MKKIAYILLAVWMTGTARGAEATWLTSLPDAVAQAKAGNKAILLDFTGSDWCGWCMKLDADTFSQQAFVDYASQNLILVRLDFPRQKPQSDDEKAANQLLAKKYSVNGYPTVVLVSAEGKTLWKQTGYAPGGPAVMISKLNESLKAVGIAARIPVATPPKEPTVTAPAQPAAPYAVTGSQQYVPPPRNPADEPKLQAILYSAAHSSVVIDGESCEEGETVHGARILKISRYDVTVEFKGQTNTLSMK